MPILTIDITGDGCWKDLKDKADKIIDLMGPGNPIQLALLMNATILGKPAVILRIDLPDGQVILTQTTFELFEHAYTLLKIGIENHAINN